MTVRELIDLLGDCDPEATVLLGHQPSWPLQFEVAGIADWEGVDDDSDHVANDQPVVYVVEGDHPESTPYAPRELWDVVRSA